MLTCGDAVFTTGCSSYTEASPGHPDQPKIYVRVEFPGFPHETSALLDTGSAFSVIHEEDAAHFDFSADALETTDLITPFGRIRGHLRRGTVTLLAEEGMGESLQLDAVWLVTPDWFRGRIVLGYRGLLHHIRFAVDPGLGRFHFGELG